MFEMLKFRVVGIQRAVDVVCNMYNIGLFNSDLLCF